MWIRNRKVLHVDDDAMITAMTQAKLRASGIETVPLNDPSQLLDRLLHDPFHVVLLDVQMPRYNGLELLPAIKRLDGGIAVIMMTGIVSQATILQSFRRGASACFFKPVTEWAPLVAAIEAAFQNIDNWRQTLHNLAQLRRQEELMLESSWAPPTSYASDLGIA